MHTGFNPAWINDCEPKQVYKHDARSRVWRIDAPDGRAFVVKQFQYNPFRQLLGAALRIHPAQREQRTAKQLIAIGLPVAPIIASGYQRTGPGIRLWLATPHKGISLHNLFNQGHLTDPDRRQRILQAVGQLASDLIQHNLFNRDHKASNILIDDQDKPWLIDVGAVRRSSSHAGADRMLANLCHTLTQAGAPDADLALVRRASKPNSPNPKTASKR
jgi:tRNA A-37 threonylcarbamoyl transferase component Bud32